MNFTDLRKLLADPEARREIISKTLFLGDSLKTPIRQRLVHIDTNNFSLIMCKECGVTPVKWSQKTQSYRTYCSSKCMGRSDTVTQKRKATCIEKYGYATNLSDPTNQQKQAATCLAKYGADNFAKTQKFLDQYQQTCLTKYGVTNASKLQSVKDKIDDTHLAKFGRKRASQVHIPLDAIALKNDAAIMRHWFVDMKMPVNEIADILNVNHSQLCVHFKNNLGIDISRHQISSIERQVGEFLIEIGVQYEASNRTLIGPKELDIVCHDYKIAIELDGLAWHSELRGKDKSYHINKTTACEQAGYRLIHIIDSEWLLKKEIVKSRLAGIFGKNQKIGARKCQLVQVSSTQALQFFSQSHIQGSCVQSVAYGLEYNGQLVACMSFGKSRFNKQYDWELLRFANKLNFNVVGAASKLFSHFIKLHTVQLIVSYCDLRWNTGTVYHKLGFTQVRQTLPNYWYTKNYKTLESRLKYQKHKLSKLLDTFDSNQTEWENMAGNKFDRIWDCGNLVFEWRAAH